MNTKPLQAHHQEGRVVLSVATRRQSVMSDEWLR